MRPKIVDENIDNFNAVTKDAVARFVKLREACGPDADHMPDLEEEISKWSTESMFYRLQFPSSTVNSLINGHPRIAKKCPLVELSTCENYSYKRAPKKNRVDVRLGES